MPEDWVVTGVPAQPGCGCWDAPGVRERLSLRPEPQAQPQAQARAPEPHHRGVQGVRSCIPSGLLDRIGRPTVARS